MFAYLYTFLQQPDILMLLTILIMGLIGFVLRRIFDNWQQLPDRNNSKAKEAYWKDF